jgi:hypothetical protein
MNIAIASVRTFVAIACSAGLVACIDGDDLDGPDDPDTTSPRGPSFELVLDGEKLAWTPANDAPDQGLSGALRGEAFGVDAALLTLSKNPGILEDEGAAGLLWRARGGELAIGKSRCADGNVVMAIRFPHLGHLVTHVDAVNGGAAAMATPVTAGVDCVIDVTRADKAGGFIEGTIDATLAYVPFQVAPSSNVVDFKRLSGSFKLKRSADVTE